MATLLFRSSVAGSAEIWRAELARLLPECGFRVAPAIGDPADIEYALVWRPEPGLLASLPNLRLILSLGAGVDHILADAGVPRHLPLVRLVDPHMTAAMSEYVLAQVLRLHRRDIDYRVQQQGRVWCELAQPNAPARRVGILGCGALGRDAARRLRRLGFDVACWSRRPHRIAGIAVHAGADGLAALLARSEILVCLLPLTAATENILDAALVARLPRGAALVNVARGGHLVEADLLAALDSGRLSGAVLDVFRDEPLPGSHPFWTHPRIVVTPHVAAATNPATAAPIVADTIRRFAEGRALRHRVDHRRGY